MAQTVSLILSAEKRAQLAAIIADRNRPQKHVQRAHVDRAEEKGAWVLIDGTWYYAGFLALAAAHIWLPTFVNVA